MDMKATGEDLLAELERAKDSAVHQLISTYEGLKRTLEEQAAFKREVTGMDAARFMERAEAVAALRVNLNRTAVNIGLVLDGQHWGSGPPFALSEPLEPGRYRFLVIAHKLKDGE
jgi:hypothetical protein